MQDISRNKIENVKGRDSYIDFLRFGGLVLIFLAHVNSPNIIYQLRSFDVPLMVFVSGLCCLNSKTINNRKKYYQNRCSRIIIPVYLFLSFFFFISYLVGKEYSFQQVICTFLLFNYGSIGYVWIMKVFLLIMLVTPDLVRINKKLSNNNFLLFILVLFVINETLALIMPKVLSFNSKIFVLYNEYIPYVLSYSIIYLIGIRVSSISSRDISFLLRLFFLILCFGLLLYLLLNSLPINITPQYKYPPRFFFLIYGICVSVSFYYFRAFFSRFCYNKILVFMGQNTIWIYLWHIVFLEITIYNYHWLIDWFLIFVFSFIVFYIQYKLVFLLKKKRNYRVLKYLIG